MQRFFIRIRRVVFWLAWPFWFFYFKAVSNRTRILVIADGKLLIVRSWLDGESWSLPGGGAKRNEDLRDGAIRELREETGIQADADQLWPLGARQRKEHGLSYTAHYFLLKLDTNELPKRQLHEIADVGWFTREELERLKFNLDAQYGLEEYRDKLWYND